MVTNQNPAQPGNPQSDYNKETAMQNYILYQGQQINRLHGILQSSAIVRGFKTFLSVLLEILMYLLFLAAIVLLIMIPTDPLVFSEQLNNTTSISGSIHSDEIAGVMTLIKVMIFLISLPILFCAILLRRNRKKSALIDRAFAETDNLKKGFEQAMQHFRFNRHNNY